MTRAFLNIPNTLTVVRIIIIPAFITALEYQRFTLALGLFVAAAISDLLDGLIARLGNQTTSLGMFLDPLADKFMLVTSFIFFTVFGWVPAWLTIILISRDVFLITGWIVLYFTNNRLRVDTLMSGKIAIALQFLLLTVILLNKSLGVEVDSIEHPLIWICAFTAVVSGIHYIVRGLGRSSEAAS